ncbi:MAG TPA: response regulator [Cyclobacteriaceae bacterium]|nr:response regulator [Cyclobacteriaceae bacterium]
MSKASILIVEDSFIVAYHLQVTLESEGYQVLEKCDSGETAVQFVESQRPDLVLMDIMLNGKMDGIDAAAILKSKFNIPVIYITALTDKGTIARAKVTEPYGYLTKPFEDREIFTVIEMALYKHDIESRLKQSEEKYFSTINSISDAVVAINKDFNITYVNPSGSGITGWAMNEAIGKPVTTVLKLRNEKTDEVNINPIQCSIGSGNISRMPEGLILCGRHGKELSIGESSLSPLLDTKGNFVGLIIVFKDLTEKKQHQKLMEEMERQRKSAIIEGQEKERARIAKDLHDGLGQILNAIKMNTGLIVADSGDAKNLSRLLDEAIQESIRISENLLPAKLRDFDLSTSLRSLCSQINKSAHFEIAFEDHDIDLVMPQSKKINFYRIAQEALNNAIKHARAKNITVQLSEEQGYVRLSIEDDGVGITSKSENSSLHQNGVINMRDRAEILGGKFTMESDSKRGTMIIVEVPTNRLVNRE